MWSPVTRGVAAILCAEGAFFCWSTVQRRAIGKQPLPYADEMQPPSGRPFTREMREQSLQRLVETEFGNGRTPERGERWLEGWFFGQPFDEIDREAALTFLAWAWFNYASSADLRAEEADEVEGVLKRFEALSVRKLKLRDPAAPAATPPPRTPRAAGLECMRPNADSTHRFAMHKPLAVYILTEFIIGNLVQRLLLAKLGFEAHTVRASAGAPPLRYWHKAAPIGEDGSPHANKAPPLVLFHGIGIGWGVVYPDLLAEMVSAAHADGRAVLAVSTPHIAITTPHDYGATPVENVASINAMLSRHSYPCADYFAHSYGTLYVAHLLKQHPSLVRSATLIDPVCVGVHRATLCRRFLYEPSSGGERSVAVRIREWLIHRDPRIVGTLMRGFFWFENALWLDDADLDGGANEAAAAAGGGSEVADSGTISLFVAADDRYIDARTIYADALAEMARRDARGPHSKGRRLRAVLWEGQQDHGEFLAKPEQRRAVVESALGRA